jgi:hypothetical protein
MKTVLAATVAFLVANVVALAQTPPANDYPTATRADYVFACMKANGETQPMLERCSCSIDVIASLIPHEKYIEAETFLRMSQLTGEAGVLFRTSEKSHAAVDALRRAQAEAEIRCFE